MVSCSREAVKGLPGAPLGCLRVPRPHPGGREVSPRPGKPLLQLAHLSLELVLCRQRFTRRARRSGNGPFGLFVLLPLPRRALFGQLRFFSVPPCFSRVPPRSENDGACWLV